MMAATVLATEGWSEVNPGSLTPLNVLARAAVESRARLVGLALSVNQSTETIEALVRDLLAGLDTAAPGRSSVGAAHDPRFDP